VSLQAEVLVLRHQLNFRGMNLPEILAHRAQLQLVIRNLVTNAIEAMGSVTDRERMLEITCEMLTPSSLRLIVADTGTGIDPEIEGRIYA
jgi:signal transduction histidine kinase